MSDPASVPPVGARGPRRPRLEDAALESLLAQARALGHEIDEHAGTVRALTARRYDVIRQLHAGGISVRAIAAALSIASSTVQTALSVTDRAE